MRIQIIYNYIYTLTYVYLQSYRYSDFHINLHLPCRVPLSSMEGFFLRKELPEKLFKGEILGKNLWGEVHGGTNGHIISM